MKGFKNQNPKLKLIPSIGGWNFPSEYWSAATRPENRDKFVDYVIEFVDSHGMDGFDIDWEYPCSEPRMNSV